MADQYTIPTKKICTILGCDKPLKARGLCNAHWARWSRNGDASITLRPTYGKGKDAAATKRAKKKYRDRHRETLRAAGRAYSKKNQSKSKQCKKEWREANPFQSTKNNRSYYQLHKAETYERGRAWNLKNPGRSAANSRRRRARLGGGILRLPGGAWQFLLDVYANRCAYCLKRTKLEQDHVAPISRGGTHSVDNIVPACQHCNRSKGDRPILFFFC